MNPNHVGEYIGMLRKKKGLTQVKLGEVIGVSDKTISKWENGDGLPDVGILASLASALDTSVDSILNGGPIPFMRLLKSTGTKRDIAAVKLAIVGFISTVSLFFGLKVLYGYLTIKQQLLRTSFDFGGLFHFDLETFKTMNSLQSEMGNGIDLSITAATALFLTGFSYFIYKFYKKTIDDRLRESINFNFYEFIMKCLQVLVVVYVAVYEIVGIIPGTLLDSRLILFLASAIYLALLKFKLVGLLPKNDSN